MKKEKLTKLSDEALLKEVRSSKRNFYAMLGFFICALVVIIMAFINGEKPKYYFLLIFSGSLAIQFNRFNSARKELKLRNIN